MNAALPLFTLAFAAMACLCLAMERHARALGPGSPVAGRGRQLRAAGWLLLVLAALVSIARSGWGLGALALLGALSAAALLVVTLVSFRPRWLLGCGAASALAGLLAAGPVLWPGS